MVRKPRKPEIRACKAGKRHIKRRYCNEKRIEKPKKYFANRDKAREWIILNQFGRRNLTAFQRAELALKLELWVKAEAKARQGSRNDLNIVQKSAPSLKTRDKLASIAGISHDTLKKAKVIKEEGTRGMPLSATKKPPPVRAAA